MTSTIAIDGHMFLLLLYYQCQMLVVVRAASTYEHFEP